MQVNDLRIDRVTGDEMRMVGALDRHDRGSVEVAAACHVDQVVEVGRWDRADPALANQIGQLDVAAAWLRAADSDRLLEEALALLARLKQFLHKQRVAPLQRQS